MKSTAPSERRAAAVRHAQRVSGQVDSLPTMIAAERPLADLAQQVVAARASLDALLLRVIDLEIDRSPQTRGVRLEVERLLRLALGSRRRGHLVPMRSAGAAR